MGVWDRLSAEGELPEWTELGRQVVLYGTAALVVVALVFASLTGGDDAPPSTTVGAPVTSVPGTPSDTPAGTVTLPTVAAGEPDVVDAAGDPVSVDPEAVASIEDVVASVFGERADLIRVTVTSVGPAGSPIAVTVDVDDPDQGIVAYDVTVADTAAGWEEVTDGGAAGP